MLCAARNVTSGGLEGASEKKNFLGSLSFAIFRAPHINYAIIRPLIIAHRSQSYTMKWLADFISNLGKQIGFSAPDRPCSSRL